MINIAASKHIFYLIPTSGTCPAAVNPNGNKTLLANAVSTLLMNGKAAFINGPRA